MHDQSLPTLLTQVFGHLQVPHLTGCVEARDTTLHVYAHSLSTSQYTVTLQLQYTVQAVTLQSQYTVTLQSQYTVTLQLQYTVTLQSQCTVTLQQEVV